MTYQLQYRHRAVSASDWESWHVQGLYDTLEKAYYRFDHEEKIHPRVDHRVIDVNGKEIPRGGDPVTAVKWHIQSRLRRGSKLWQDHTIYHNEQIAISTFAKLPFGSAIEYRLISRVTTAVDTVVKSEPTPPFKWTTGRWKHAADSGSTVYSVIKVDGDDAVMTWRSDRGQLFSNVVNIRENNLNNYTRIGDLNE